MNSTQHLIWSGMWHMIRGSSIYLYNYVALKMDVYIPRILGLTHCGSLVARTSHCQRCLSRGHGVTKIVVNVQVFVKGTIYWTEFN